MSNIFLETKKLKIHKSGKGGFFSRPPHSTPHAGPHGALHQGYRAVAGQCKGVMQRGQQRGQIFA